MECFRIDESGYTGFDLLNPDQRFQGAAAIAISNEDAARLIKEYFPRLQAARRTAGSERAKACYLSAHEQPLATARHLGMSAGERSG